MKRINSSDEFVEVAVVAVEAEAVGEAEVAADGPVAVADSAVEAVAAAAVEVAAREYSAVSRSIQRTFSRVDGISRKWIIILIENLQSYVFAFRPSFVVGQVCVL